MFWRSCLGWSLSSEQRDRRCCYIVYTGRTSLRMACGGSRIGDCGCFAKSSSTGVRFMFGQSLLQVAHFVFLVEGTTSLTVCLSLSALSARCSLSLDFFFCGIGFRWCVICLCSTMSRTRVADKWWSIRVLLCVFAIGGSLDLVRSVSGTTAMLLLIVCNLQLFVSSCDAQVFSVLPRTSYYVGISSTIHCSHIFLFSVGVRLLSDLFPSFRLFVWDVSRGSTTGSNDDVQPRIVHSDCGVTIKVTSFAPI